VKLNDTYITTALYNNNSVLLYTGLLSTSSYNVFVTYITLLPWSSSIIQVGLMWTQKKIFWRLLVPI